MEQQKNTTDIIAVGNLCISIIKNDIAGEVCSLPADVDFLHVLKFCENHKITPLVAKAIINSEVPSTEVKQNFKKELFRASMRYETQCREKEELTELFVQNKIHHCFLKGQKISKYYKAPEERYMLDMDIYIQRDKISEAEEIIKKRGYKLNTYGDDKDIGYIKKPFLNVELHRELKYDYDKGYDYYKGAFQRLVPESNNYTLNMTNEDFYVYILSHSAHHFATSGTGIRNILDHFYLKNNLKPLCNVDVLNKSLDDVGLSVFEHKLDCLADYWFAGGTANDDIDELAEYVMLSGVFGNETNKYLNSFLRGEYSDKKSSFVFKRLFPSAKILSPRYPKLNKLPFLLPFYWIVRIIEALFNKTDIAGEIKEFDSANAEDKDNFKEFMQKNGL